MRMQKCAARGSGGGTLLTSALNVACTAFRDVEGPAPSIFNTWPERRSHTLCCGSQKVITNYSYPGRPCDPLKTGLYYDECLVQWYFRWDFSSFLDKSRPQAQTFCEYSVLQDFYKQLFYIQVFFHGVLFAIAFVIFTQFVLCCVWLFGLKRPLAMWSDNYDAALISCFHMGLLVVNGFATMVAAGHGSLLSFYSDWFSCAMVMYSYLTLLSCFCNIFEHLAYEEDRLLGEKLYLALRHVLKHADWRWQPVWAQLAAAICIFLYCTSVETSPGQLDQAAALTLPIIILAIFWSAGSAMVYVVQVAQILTIEFLRATHLLAMLRSAGIFKPSGSTASPANALASLSQMLTKLHPNPNTIAININAHPNLDFDRNPAPNSGSSAAPGSSANAAHPSSSSVDATTNPTPLASAVTNPSAATTP